MRLLRRSSSDPLDRIRRRLARQRAVVFRVDDGVPDWLVVQDSSPDSVAELGSITKLFTAMGLAVSGLDCSDSVAATLGWSEEIEVEGRPVSLDDLATHHGGLPRLPDRLLRADPRDPYRDTTAESVLIDLRSWVETGMPVAKRVYEYSNFGYALLGHAIAKGTTTWGELVDDTLRRLDPGIEIWPDRAPEGRERAPARSRRGREVPWWTMGGYAPAGGASGSAHGLAAFAAATLRAHADPTHELHRAVVEATTTRHRVAARAGIALGWHVIGEDPDPVLWHNGATGGSTSFLALRPARRRGVGLLASGPPDDEVEQAVGRLLADPDGH
ncbi:MAG: serine hydrolase domain-containing protein [Actinomycetota bacterium]